MSTFTFTISANFTADNDQDAWDAWVEWLTVPMNLEDGTQVTQNLPDELSEPEFVGGLTAAEDAERAKALASTDCWWCGRSDNEGSITDDNGDTFHYCHRHEDQARSLIVGGES